jgi:hypothetical protein
MAKKKGEEVEFQFRWENSQLCLSLTKRTVAMKLAGTWRTKT